MTGIPSLKLLKTELPEMVKVESSNLEAVGYKLESKEVFVTFKGGGGSVYRYECVDIVTFNQMMEAKSIGSAFHAILKSCPQRFPCSRVEILELEDIKRGETVPSVEYLDSSEDVLPLFEAEAESVVDKTKMDLNECFSKDSLKEML